MRQQSRCLKYLLKLLQRLCKKFFQIKDQGHYFLGNQRDFVIPTVKSVNYGLEALGFKDQKYVKAFQIIWKIKSQFKVSKWLLRNANQNHDLAVSVEHSKKSIAIKQNKVDTNQNPLFYQFFVIDFKYKKYLGITRT